MLTIDTMKSGYDAFYTLKPETWKEDLNKAYKIIVKNKEKYFQENMEILKSKLNLFLEAEEKINQHI